MIFWLVLSAASEVFRAQRIFTSIATSVETAPYAALQNVHGCGQISTASTPIFTLDMGEGSATSTPGPAPVPSANLCAGGKIQCPRCFIVKSGVADPVRIDIHTCHAPTRQPVGPASAVTDKIPAAPACGFLPAVPAPIQPACPACTSNAAGDCTTCINNRVRCFEDCDPVLAAIPNTPAAASQYASYCSAQTTPSPLCESCSAPHPAAPWAALPTTQLPNEGGQQFYYISDARFYEYTFINASPSTLTVSTSPSSNYPAFADNTLPDASTVAADRSKSAICFRGRFYWQ